MSDLKLYRILETFDELESATDKLTPVKEEDVNAEEVTEEAEEVLDEAEEAVDESQTKVQTMGNKVKVTTDGDTTEFDDAETAKAMMGDDEDENQFATESEQLDEFESPEEIINYADVPLPKEPSSDIEFVDYDNLRPPVEPMDEASPIARKGELNTPRNQRLVAQILSRFPTDDENDVWNWLVSADDFGQPLTVAEYSDYRAFGEDGTDIAEGGLGGDDWDDAADALEFGGFDDPYNEIPPEMGDLEVPVYNPDASDLGIDADAAYDELGEACMDEDTAEFATFDSENESHRKRLQRGTPVVLDPELFTDPDVNRRGVFVSRSPGGDFAKVVRDFDGKETKVHLSDIKSADLVNNSVYEEYNINFDALLAEDITMTQTTNLENPENDTTTVTAVGNEAGEELAAMMANAGLNTGEYASMDAPPIDAGPVDTGEPEAPAEPGMQDMIGIIDGPEPEAMESLGDDDNLPPMYTPDDEMDVEPSNADLDAIDMDNEFDLDFDMDESAGEVSDQGVPIHRPMTRDQAMASNVSSELENILGKFDSSDILAWLEDGNDSVDEALYAISMEDMPYGTQKARTGDPQEWLYNRYYEEIADYAKDNFGSHLGEAGRDIEHANTPDEREAGVDMVTHGTSGGLNRPKNAHKLGNRWGDNGMADMYEAEMHDADKDGIPGDIEDIGNEIGEPDKEEVDEALSPEMQKRKEADFAKAKADRDWSTKSKGSRLTGKGRGTAGYDRSVKTEYESVEHEAEIVEDDSEFKYVNEHESVDNFLDMYKEFKIRTDKK